MYAMPHTVLIIGPRLARTEFRSRCKPGVPQTWDMPIPAGTWDPIEFPLRGYTIYADDLPLIAQRLGTSWTCLFRTHDGQTARHRVRTLDELVTRLARDDVAEFELSGALTFTLKSHGRGRRCSLWLDGDDMRQAHDVISVLTPRRLAVLPWRAYDSCFVRMTREQVVHRRRSVIGLVAGATVTVLATLLSVWLA